MPEKINYDPSNGTLPTTDVLTRDDLMRFKDLVNSPAWIERHERIAVEMYLGWMDERLQAHGLSPRK